MAVTEKTGKFESRVSTHIHTLFQVDGVIYTAKDQNIMKQMQLARPGDIVTIEHDSINTVTKYTNISQKERGEHQERKNEKTPEPAKETNASSDQGRSTWKSPAVVKVSTALEGIKVQVEGTCNGVDDALELLRNLEDIIRNHGGTKPG